MGTVKRTKKEGMGGLRVIIAGGGTGGHLFPGIAVGREILKRDRSAEILFVTAGRKIESHILADAGFEQVTIRVQGMKGRGWRNAVKAMLILPCGLIQSLYTIKKFSPSLVLGVGGYSSGPVCLAAWLMRIPGAIHEQNSFPGLTNRLLCRIVDKVFISFEESREHFSSGALFLTGNPIRKEFVYAKEGHGKIEKRFTILVTGGSQGATAINSAFLGALEILRDRGKDLLVIHHTGERDFDRVVREYEKRGLRGDIMPFIQDMNEACVRADIFVGRAGAGTVFELAALGKPSVLIPYPHAANRHQESNARVLVKAGGAEMFLEDNLSPLGLADLLMRYMEDRDALKNMGERARTVARPDAARVIVDQLEDMVL
ncbi:undecaprenyldiphospho-muramoylpentapeptide beta-N-acetylglucosaminyltransferase [Deltaproteobacteria bacterium]|nr:undecaprenyldiphospho-muramoylpentapeptide beta-N-acetylglucosaminyltransferase [Deltaproteobacteria bacterium]